MKKYKPLSDKKKYEWAHFSTYCLLKTVLVINLIKQGITKKEEIYSVLYPFYLKEKKKYWKSIQEIEKSICEVVDKIKKMKKNKRKFAK